MSLSDITPADVLKAVEEFDHLGRDEFLQRHGFGQARTYFLQLGGKRYDSKAIMGVAHGFATGQPWGSEDFSGGDATVVRRLRDLGFVVGTHRNPNWSRDEVVLACALVAEHDWRPLEDTDSRVAELSDLLQTQRRYPSEVRGPDFRNRNSVARKTSDVATQHPEYRGRPTNGGRHDREVLLAFLADPEGMKQEAAAIRTVLMEDTAGDVPAVADLDLDGLSVDEGQAVYRRHLRYERNPKLRAAAVAHAKRRAGEVACEACGFNFGQVYGERGQDFIECHHKMPLHVSGPTGTSLADLALLCSNCHRMVHCKTPWLRVEELIGLVTERRDK